MMMPDIAPPTLSDRLSTVKAAWDEAPAGPEKDAAHAHCVPAGKAMGAGKDQDCMRRLDAAEKALS